MNLESVKKQLKDGYERHGFDVVSESANGETILRFPAPDTYQTTFRITKEDINEYGELLKARKEFQTIGKTGFANRNFREHLLLPLDANIQEVDLQDLIFKSNRKGKTYVEIDTASSVFANYFRFMSGYLKLCIDRIYRFTERQRQDSLKNPIDIRYLFARPLTIRVYEIGASSFVDAVHISDELIDGALFTLAHDYGISLMLAPKWQTSRTEYLERLHANDHKSRRIVLPQAGFRRDLVRYYQVALSSAIASHRFLALYQILQMFFQEVNHSAAYDALYHLLRDENFKADNNNLTRIIQLVEINRNAVDDVQRLEQLLRQHVGAEAIKGYIEFHSGNAEETIQSLASRLSKIHSAILEAGVTALPVDDASIEKDLPLLQFLAEKVILATRES